MKYQTEEEVPDEITFSEPEQLKISECIKYFIPDILFSFLVFSIAYLFGYSIPNLFTFIVLAFLISAVARFIIQGAIMLYFGGILAFVVFFGLFFGLIDMKKNKFKSKMKFYSNGQSS